MNYNYWIPTGREKRDKKRQLLLECQCVCGTKRFILESYLRKGASKSCGCKKAELISKARKKHGHSGQHSNSSPTYNSWRSMIVRCTKEKHHAYKNYGGRGVTVCKRWLKFSNFLADMGERPRNCELDRKNNNKGYSKSNCRWVTRSQNLQNSRKSKFWVIGTRTFSSAQEAAEKLGVTKQTIIRWCTGYNPRLPRKYGPLKKGCYAYLKYKEKQP